jgi:hypothetical protein
MAESWSILERIREMATVEPPPDYFHTETMWLGAAYLFQRPKTIHFVVQKFVKPSYALQWQPAHNLD